MSLSSSQRQLSHSSSEQGSRALDRPSAVFVGRPGSLNLTDDELMMGNKEKKKNSTGILSLQGQFHRSLQLYTTKSTNGLLKHYIIAKSF